ncbi:MAG TPA: DUF3500 domain-containing protein [Terriglobia bacterium]|nr:DUF3500 domain-containing protein [Terriglobia bacterium]
MNRRTAIKTGVSLGVLAGTGLYGGYRFLPPGRSSALEPVDALARRFFIGLDPEQRAETCVGYDHPLRQYHNRGVWGGGRSILFGFNREQRGILTDLLYSGLSAEGRGRVPEEYFARWSGVHSMRALICGDPTVPPYQIILTGPHLNLRLGGKSREGVAFGGPQVYGDQHGNERVGLPGNLYRDQFLLGQRILRSLDDGRKKQALLEEAPVQTQVELQGRHGSFAGIPVRDLTPEGKALARELVERIFSTYPATDVTYARECLEANGGLDALFVSYYQHGEDGEIPEGQVFRLEGPAAVFYFRGHPHVHAFLNVAMDGDAPLSVGEPLGTNPAWLDRARVKALFQTALRAETGSELAYYHESSVVGRLRPGLIRSGDIYNLESWQETVEVVEVRGSNLSATLLAELRGLGMTLDGGKTYKVATTSYIASELAQKLGRIDTRRPGPLLRDLTVAYLRAHSFPQGS